MENRDTLGRVVTCSFKYSVLTGSGRCLKNPDIRSWTFGYRGYLSGSFGGFKKLICVQCEQYSTYLL